jgi:hypothetical protein
MPPDEPDVVEQPLRLTDDMKVAELVEVFEHVLWRRDNLCAICLDRGVHTFILRALKQR